MAILLEADDAEQSVETIATALQAVANWLDLESRDGTRSRPLLRRSDYLVTTIYELSLPTETNSGGILDAPAFAAVDDMLVIALSVDHIRNIVDAHFGFAPPLGDLSESWMIDRHANQAAMRMVAQPALAMQVVDQWLMSPDGPLAGWMTLALGVEGDRDAAVRDSHTPRVGIGTRPGVQPGTVQVGRVNEGGRADGLLQPGDKIQGLNGHLLALTDPTADLRRRLAQSASAGNWTFRVQRGDDILDVIVPAIPSRKRSPYAADPAGALRQFQELLRPIDFAVASVIESGPNELAAKLTLRFSQP